MISDRPVVITMAVVPAHSTPPLAYMAVSTAYTTVARAKNPVRISKSRASICMLRSLA
ncbi:Uncharacterised protein [Mycobacteroides abscessus subsp. massiliense]|nr:Uncharacterised protein [Mycobacteroides abscessus subsp. massiliense]